MPPVARISLLLMFFLCPAVSQAQVLGDPADVSQDFQKMENVYFVGSRCARPGAEISHRLSALCREYKSQIANALGVIVYEAKNNASQVSRECGVRHS
jgi:hypothetical protein